MAPLTHPDGPLALSLRRLDEAMHQLAWPLASWSAELSAVRWCDALYTRLRTSLSGNRVIPVGVHCSRPPCHSSILSLLCDIDTTVDGWLHPGGDAKGATVSRLRALSRAPLAATGLRSARRLHRIADALEFHRRRAAWRQGPVRQSGEGAVPAMWRAADQAPRQLWRVCAHLGAAGVGGGLSVRGVWGVLAAD